MRKSLRLLLAVLVLLPVISVVLAAGGATNASANANVEITGAVVKIRSVDTSHPGFDYSTTPPSTRYRWVRIWLKALNFTRQTLTLQCKLDKAAWAPCGKYPGSGNSYRTFKGLAPGLHTIRVRLVDSAGNVPPTVSVYPYGDTSLPKAPTFFSWRVTSGVPGPTPPPPGPPPPAPGPRPSSLLAQVDSGGSIFLRAGTGGGQPRALKAGAYEIVVIDGTRLHNVHLVASGINLRTGIAQATPQPRAYSVATVTWRVTLKPGNLTVYSDGAPTRRISITVVS